MTRLPSRRDRTAVVGFTGSGKTLFGNFLLSKRDLKKETWVYLDFKNDSEDIVNQLSGVKHIDYHDMPKKPGLYAIHPFHSEKEEINNFLWKLWDRRNVGIYVDEMYPLNDSDAIEAILTQGRSLYIPVIMNAQRPAFITRFMFSEAQYISVFHLNDVRDWKTISGYMPIPHEQWILDNMHQYHSLWFDVTKRQLTLFKPAPSKDEIFARLDAQLRTRKI